VRVTLTAAVLLAYVFGFLTCAFIVAIVLLVHGGRDLRDEDARRQDRLFGRERG
jgi:hypothetical protein